jgi:hypothetical protein
MGRWTILLAQRGWQATGVDIVSKALRVARDRARKAGVSAEFIEGDATALRAAGVGPAFRLVLDFGMLHGLSESQVKAAAREVDAIATADASVLMVVWSPGRRGPLPRGLSRGEVEQSFHGWRVTDEEPFDASVLPKPLRRVKPWIYRLRRQ